MSQEPDIEHDDYDMEDLEHRLYAEIHYNSGATDGAQCSKDVLKSVNIAKDNDRLHSVSAHCLVKRSAVSETSSKSNSVRYWDNSPNYVPFYNKKHSGVYKAIEVNDVSKSYNANSSKSNPEPQNNPINPSDNRPKLFTPYKPLLSVSGLRSESVEQQASISASINQEKDDLRVLPALKTTSKLIKDRQKNVNPFNSKRKNPLATDAAPKNDKRLNPFSRLCQKKDKAKEKYEAKKNRAQKNREKVKKKAIESVVLNVDDDNDDNDDDDVVILPTQSPPLIYIESSEDESTSKETVDDHEFTEPMSTGNKRSKSIRCPSPTSSIQSADDFIVQNDRRSFDFDAFNAVTDEDLYEVCETVENALRKTNEDSKITVVGQTNDTVFTAPKQKQKEKSKQSKPNKSYEVGENSFAAVDVYESESSDMPESVYAKGNRNKRKQNSNSDSSSVESVTVTKAKRLRKRKSSGSAKESDCVISDSSEFSSDDADKDNDMDTVGSYIMRGEALGKVKKSNNRKAKNALKQKENKKSRERHSDDDFITKLSSIVHGAPGSDDNDEHERSRESSTESIAARDIVQSVLQRRSKRASKKNSFDPNESETLIETWTVSDHVGTTDDVVLNTALQFFNDVSGRSNTNKEIQSEQLHLNSTKEQAQLHSIVLDDAESSKTRMDSMKVRAGKGRAKPVQNDESGFKVRGFPSDVHSEIGWNKEMHCFYNNSWGGEGFNVKHIQGKMSKKFLEWAISNKDKFPDYHMNKRYNRTARCVNCRERGHRSFECPHPPTVMRCYMCGEEGHMEPRCPNTICLRCGKKARTFSYECNDCFRVNNLNCFVCKRKGHRQSTCPDRWRRYHTTTETNTQLVEHETPLPIKPKYCCVCGRKGHIAEMCGSAYRIGELPIDTVFVKNYRQHYRKERNTKNTVADYTILSTNLNDFRFDYGNDVTEHGNTFYARFKRAVNLKKKVIAKSATKRVVNVDVEKKREKKSKSAVETSVSLLDEHLPSTNSKNDARNLNETNGSSQCIDVGSTNQDLMKSHLQSTDDDMVGQCTTKIAVVDEEFSAEQSQADAQNASAPETLERNDTPMKNSFLSELSDVSDTMLAVSKCSETDDDRTEHSIDTTKTDTSFENTLIKLVELEKLNNNIKTLTDLKQQIIQQNQFKPECDTTSVTTTKQKASPARDSDSNYSFSEFYKGVTSIEQPCSVALPDFIPLDSDTHDRFVPARSLSPEMADSTTTTTIATDKAKCDAKIFLTKDHCNYLCTNQGNVFLRNYAKKNNVLVRMEWQSIGNILIVNGLPQDQERFHSDLIGFFTTVERKLKARGESNIPKNRISLIRFIRETFSQLDKPPGNVKDLFIRMSRYNEYNTKASNKNAERLRKQLNIILFGKYGFSGGDKHVIALQDSLRQLTQSSEANVSVDARRSIGEHLNFVFSPYKHENYADLVEMYMNLKKTNRLPVLNLDRKLLGLKINVYANAASLAPSKGNEAINTDNGSYESLTKPTVSNFNSTTAEQALATCDASKLPTLMDIKINVSMPSIVAANEVDPRFPSNGSKNM